MVYNDCILIDFIAGFFSVDPYQNRVANVYLLQAQNGDSRNKE